MSQRAKYRQWNPHTGQFTYWGFVSDGTFSAPITADGQWLETPHEQVTGLEDKNGKEIYEGDIVAAKLNGGYVERVYWKGPPDIVGEVYWDLTGFRLKANGEKDFRYADFTDFAEKDDWEPLVMMSESHSEVIGNIHETPELLK